MKRELSAGLSSSLDGGSEEEDSSRDSESEEEVADGVAL